MVMETSGKQMQVEARDQVEAISSWDGGRKAGRK